MGIISVEHTDRLLWLGRYSERVYTTLKIFASYFDSMIDLNVEEFERFCVSQDIPDIYSSVDDFTQQFCFGEDDPNSIYSNLMRAYDNAIVLREETFIKKLGLKNKSGEFNILAQLLSES